MMHYSAMTYEKLLTRILPACSNSKGKLVQQTVSIIDLSGATIFQVKQSFYNFLQLSSKLGQDDYPELLGKMYIVNASWLFEMV